MPRTMPQEIIDWLFIIPRPHPTFHNGYARSNEKKQVKEYWISLYEMLQYVAILINFTLL